MEFKQYPSYKKSGVEWLGDVPEHWQVKPNKYVFKIQKRIAGTLGFNVLSITQKGLKIKDIESNAGQMAQDYSKYQIVNVGDFAMNHMDLLTGWIDIAKVTGVTSPDYRVFEVRNKKVNKEYFLHLFQLGYRNKILFAFGQGAAQMGRWRLQSETFNTLKMPFPSIEEQQNIVSFLNTETARIDNLIAKQEKLIELLEEQRKSVISHAVTKGLNPNVPMKDSGVEWLGEVPKHWDVAIVKRAFIVKLGKMLQPDQKDETDVFKKYLKASSITWDGVKDIDNEMWFSENELKKLKLEIGDLLVAEGGDVGKSCIFDSSEEFYYQNSVNRVRGKKNNANKFLYYWLFTLKYSGYIDILCNKSTIAHFTAEKLNETILLLPDSIEQNEIIAYLDLENEKINHLILKQNQLIEKLKEYRSSIISHAVTGKIDVREFVA